MDIAFSDVLPYVVSGVAGVAGWFVGRRKENNDFLNDLQQSVDMLAEKNRTLYEEVTDLRKDNSDFKVKVSELTTQNKILKDKLDNLSKRITSMGKKSARKTDENNKKEIEHEQL